MNKKKISLLSLILAIPLLLVALIRSEFGWGIFRVISHKEIINRYAGEYKIDPLFVMAIVKAESNFVRKAKSPAGAVGLMQLLPSTALQMARELGMRDLKESDLESPELNIRLGSHYLSKLRTQFNDNTLEMLAAYNAGLARVLEWKKNAPPFELTSIPYPETRRFIRQVYSNYALLKRFQKITNFIRK